jgi:hypothetical protein
MHETTGETMDTTTCPDCGALAEVTDRFVLESTDGPVEHVRLQCVGQHWFLLSTASLARHHAAVPVPAPVSRPDARPRRRPARRWP